MRASTSLALLLVSVGCALGQAFGRFGYQPYPDLPGLQLTAEGISARHPAADRLSFPQPLGPLSVTNISAPVFAASMPEAPAMPSKLWVNLFWPGLNLRFEKGFKFLVGSTGSPYLTWSEGSVRDGVPTPSVPWLVVSFATNQPPLMLQFQDGPASLTIRGAGGAWSIESAPDFKGWVRIMLPIGTEGRATSSAAALGSVARAAERYHERFQGPAPRLIARRVDGNATAVEAVWRFDRPGAIVPPGAHLAPLGGYPLRIESRTQPLPASDETGPLVVTTEPSLRIRFPIRRVPSGRAVAVGPIDRTPPATVSSIDLPSVVELALENLLASSDASARRAAESATEEFLAAATYQAEPWSQQSLPYPESGQGLDLVAAHALLMQSVSSSTRATSDANSLLTSVTWRRDWFTWRVWVPDPALARRTAALAALAGAICPEPERRLEAAMLEAGLAAERGLDEWLSRRDNRPRTTFLEAMLPVRRTLFSRDRIRTQADPFALSLLSEIRAYGTVAATVEPAKGGWSLSWDASVSPTLSLASSGPLEVSSPNGAQVAVSRALGFLELRAKPDPPRATAILSLPAWMPPLPPRAPVPAYTETME